jgi:lysozyme
MKLFTLILLSTISGLLVIPHADYWHEKINQNEITFQSVPVDYTIIQSVPESINVDSFPDWFIDFIKHKEGFRSRPYICCGGVKTIGYGFTSKEILNKYSYLTEEQASDILINEVLPKYRSKVRSIVSVRLNTSQELALTSFCMNLGATNLKKLVNGSQRLNGGNYESIRNIMPKYRKAGGKVRDGLIERRAFEVDLFYADDMKLAVN